MSTLVSFETAKLAKQKGFDVPTMAFYFENYMAGLDHILVDYIGDGQFGVIDTPSDHNHAKYLIKRISVPTLEQLTAWLGERIGVAYGFPPPETMLVYDLRLVGETLDGGDCIRTASGLYMNVFEPTDEMICIEDIAHALSRQCRFGGHLPEFYSVAQHSIECAKRAKVLAQERFNDIPYTYNIVADTKAAELQALMHDASEAYLLDIPSPIKKHLSNYKSIEDGLMRIIGRKYNFTWPMSELTKEIDYEMLVFEWEHLMVQNKPLPNDFKIMTSEEAKAAFIEYFYSL